ncbi:MAG: rRNA maturation RNase YbeY [Puniceicoccales bacterium]|jgi:probable rRNA maturation factor|nr:rRNA maturation RNase YbeY [Puniceicoccales bacterium]
MVLPKAHRPVSRELDIRNECRCFSFELTSVTRMFQVLDAEAPRKAPEGTLSVAFVSLQKLRSLHQKYLSDDTPTDVMTFVGDEKMSFAGEIVVAPAFARRQLMIYQTTFSEEVILYLVHAYLHLCGFDDVEPGDRAQMREAERDYLRLLKEHGAVPSFAWNSRWRRV